MHKYAKHYKDDERDGPKNNETRIVISKLIHSYCSSLFSQGKRAKQIDELELIVDHHKKKKHLFFVHKVQPK